MRLHDSLILYSEASVDDGAGGKTPSAPVEEARLWGNVKPLGGMMGMTFQSLTGVQGYSVTVRTDFDRRPDRKYLIKYEGIYGDLWLTIHSVEVDRFFTKFICKSENATPVRYS